MASPIPTSYHTAGKEETGGGQWRRVAITGAGRFAHSSPRLIALSSRFPPWADRSATRQSSTDLTIPVRRSIGSWLSRSHRIKTEETRLTSHLPASCLPPALGPVDDAERHRPIDEKALVFFSDHRCQLATGRLLYCNSRVCRETP